MTKSITAISVLLLASLFASASEFWLEPKKFHYKVGEEVRIDFREGDGFNGEFWDAIGNKVDLIQWHAGASAKDLSKMVQPTRGNNLMLKITGTGTQLFVMRSKPAHRDWAADSFNIHLEDTGLEEVLEIRKREGHAGDSAKEDYTRFAKLLLQVGEGTDDTYKKKTGVRLEIIPAQNPYALTSGDYLQCQVLFEGKPLSHALVKVWSRLNRMTFLQNIYTEKDGTIVFPISTKGTWMVSTVKMVRSEKPGADWQSLWGSLVFGVE